MPRPKKEGAPEPKRRSRKGCWPCKARKVKCGEEKPQCLNCDRTGETCDYSIRLNWGGRTKAKGDMFQFDSRSSTNSPSTIVFPTAEELTGHKTPSPRRADFDKSPPVVPTIRHARSRSNLSQPHRDDSPAIDPSLGRPRHQHSRSHDGIGQDYSRLPDMQQTLPVGLTHSMSTGIPRTTITSAPNNTRPFNFRQHHTEYPSPTVSNLASPNFLSDGTLSHDTPAAMLRPFRSMPSLSPPIRSYSTFSDEPASMHRSKRMRIGINAETSPMTGSPHDLPFDVPEMRSGHLDVRSPHMPLLNPYSPFAGTPLTPRSSIGSEEHYKNPTKANGHHSTYMTPQPTQHPPDLRRLSVQSLLADESDFKPWVPSSQRQYPRRSVTEETTTYGYDLGLPDLDTPKNDDVSAILPFSPPPARRENVLSYLNANGETEFDDSPYNPFSADSKVIAFEPGGYYADPVPIKIRFSLEPLPPLLTENKMNLLYFHHFLNHTARILVPHDCSLNPFRFVLPEMAIKDENLLNLLLAYSASHRARLLHQPPPANRIADYVKDVFPKLRQALTSNTQITIGNLATAVMLASLEILSPGAFGVGIPWRDHLSIARQMMVAIGVTGRSNKVYYFLARWFAYLDIMGSLSGQKNDRPLSTSYWIEDVFDEDGNMGIDCLLGFTTGCVRTLAQIAELAKQCESERLDADGCVVENWQPSPLIAAQAAQLKHDLREARQQVYKPCPHGHSESDHEAGWDSLEIIATNDMFHWAGLIHLDRRVLNMPLEDQEVQHAVSEIVGGLYKIRPGSTAEANILFPLFTAGAHAWAEGQRAKIMGRLEVVETFGMTHMTKAKTLMQRTWDTGRPWESLVTDEFLG